MRALRASPGVSVSAGLLLFSSLVSAADTQPSVPVPSGLVAIPGVGQVALQWEEIDSGDIYDVFVDARSDSERKAENEKRRLENKAAEELKPAMAGRKLLAAIFP